MNGGRIGKIFIVCLLFVFTINTYSFADYNKSFGKNLQDIEEGLEDGNDDIWNIVDKLPVGNIISTLRNAVSFTTTWVRASKDSESGKVNILSAIETFLNIVYGDGTTKEDDFPVRLALQKTFGSNNYCSDQQLYIEESDLVSKQMANSIGNNFGVFPVYPILPKVKDNFCDINSIIDDNFKTDYFAKASNTKCSYNYNIEDPTCMIEGNIPLLVEYYVNLIAKFITVKASGCDSKGNKEDSDPKKAEEKVSTLKKVLTIAGKVIGTTIKIANLVNNILLTPLTTDPINMYGKYAIQNSAYFLTSDMFEMIKDAFSQKYHCIAIIIAFRFSDLLLMADTITIWNGVKYDQAKNIIKTHRFCGHNWETWSSDYDYNNATNNKNIPELGMNRNSRYKAVYDCMTENICDTADTISGLKILEDNYCTESVDVSSTKYDNNFCSSIEKYSKNVKNKIYREYMYLGKEIVALNKNGNLDVEKKQNTDDDEQDNRFDRIDYDYYDCIDPRLPEIKGFVQPNQRYYMRGNQKANFQCNRFFYDGEGCVINGNHISNDDKDRLRKVFDRIVYSNNDMTNYTVILRTVNNSENYGDREYFIINPNLGEEAKQLTEEFSSQCSTAFENARKCCRRRSENFVCIEEHDNQKYLGEDKTAETYFCMGNVLSNKKSNRFGTIYDAIQSKFSNKGDFLSNGSQDQVKVTCNTSSGKFEVTKKIDTQYMCVFAKSLCPYNFRLNAGLNYKASFCDSSALTGLYSLDDGGIGRTNRHLSKTQCNYGFFYNENLLSDEPRYDDADMNRYVTAMTKEYDEYAKERGYNNSVYNIFYFNKIAEDMGYTISKDSNNTDGRKKYKFDGYSKGFNRNDFDIIYDNNVYQSSVDVENMTYSDFSQYSNGNVYKIKNFCQYKAHCVEVEREFKDELTSTGLSLFIDNSCLGKSNNSRTATSIVLLGGTLPLKQFSTPIVECIYESFSNMISGMAGSSLCNSGYNLNNAGYCGGDTEESVKQLINNNRVYELKAKYKEIDGTLIIKGYPMPENYVPFIKLQKYLLNTMKALLALFLALYGITTLLNGDMKTIFEFITSPKLSQQVLNFAIVMWLAFGNGMYSTVYQKIKEFSIGTFLFVDELLVGSLMDKTSNVLKQDEKIKSLRVMQVFKRNGSSNVFPLCYHRNFNGDILFKEGKENTLTIDENNNVVCPFGYRQINNKTMYIYTGEKEMDNLSKELVISNNQAINTLLYFIDTYNAKNGDNQIFLMVDENNGGNYKDDTSGLWNPKYDGCYFSTCEYKEGKEYLALFDTMDCKMGKYFGFILDKGLPNIFIFASMMMVPDMLNGIPIVGTLSNLLGKLLNFAGTALFTLTITYFLSFVSLIIKMIFIFTTSFLNLGVLLMFTPMMLPLMLYDKTKSMFDNWFKQIRSAIMTPCMNVFPIVLVFHILDVFLFDEITFEKFTKFGRQPNVVCPKNSTNIICFISNGVPVFSQLSKIINDFSTCWKIVLNMLLSFIIIKMGENVIGELKNIISGLMPWGDKSSSLSNYTGADMIDLADTDKMLQTASNWGEKATSGAKDILKQGKDFVERTTVKGLNAIEDIVTIATGNKQQEQKTKNNSTNKLDNFNSNLDELNSYFDDRDSDINLDKEFNDDYNKFTAGEEPYGKWDDRIHKLFNPGQAIKETLDEKETRDPNSRWAKVRRGFERVDTVLKKLTSLLPNEDSYDLKANWQQIKARGQVSDYVDRINIDNIDRYINLTEKEKEETDKQVEDLRHKRFLTKQKWWQKIRFWTTKEEDLEDNRREITKKMLELNPFADDTYGDESYKKKAEKEKALEDSITEVEESKKKQKTSKEDRTRKIADLQKKKDREKSNLKQDKKK